jgi:hypothetical protein
MTPPRKKTFPGGSAINGINDRPRYLFASSDEAYLWRDDPYKPD